MFRKKSTSKNKKETIFRDCAFHFKIRHAYNKALSHNRPHNQQPMGPVDQLSL